MGWERCNRMFARMLAGVGLAAAIALGFGGSAAAAPADRGGDEVVLKGSQLSALLGAEPGRIVGFSWAGKNWRQIPVQVDERHTINVRQLYPDTPVTGYIGPTTLGFDLEVYADAKTRSGADADATFDADDEFVFMGGDAGGNAPLVVNPPEGVEGKSVVKVTVDDPVSGGQAAVYLFKSAGSLEPGAGKDYVDYDFKLTNLTEGQTLLNDYGYIHSSNPEDSTVSTANYELHSIDRWMEDELRIKAGAASQADILDREVAQATLTGCGRSEYTFSGRWTEDSWSGNDGDTDDEGTYVAVIDGPVRAIRSYMGANSGPYVQREHVYYADHEQNTVFLRVHVMLDLYAWTDYAPSAIGMTYRDEKNPGGVTIDGNPDTLVPTTSADVANGAYSWQQVSGTHGTLSTVVGSQTDIPNPTFGNYYLDDSTPVGGNEVQCGGDGQSIGASGFGILGHNNTAITPNTDPRLGDFNNLTVDRTRYFGPPSDGVTEAANYKNRVEQPLVASATKVSFKEPKPNLRVKFLNRKAKARPGKVTVFRLRLINTGNVRVDSAKVCVSSKAIAGKPCKKAVKVNPGKGRTLSIRAKVKRKIKGKRLKFGISYSGKAGGYGMAGGSEGFSLKIGRG